MYHKQIGARVLSSAWLTGILVLVVAGGLAGGYYSFLRLAALEREVEVLRGEIALNTASLRDEIATTSSSIAATLDQEKQNIEQKLGSVEKQVGSISGSVSTLEKLSRTDPELLQKYSKVFFLNEHYAPERLVEIPKEYAYNESRSYKIHAAVWPRLQRLLQDAKREGIELYVFSAYRSFEEQSALKGAYTVTYGAGSANQFSADQGYSEHQLGTTVDFITTGLGGKLTGFEKTTAYTWLLNNAHHYGFILSYPENNTHYIFEPWHWRYVGIDLAVYLHDKGKHFYDLDQREIDEYLVHIFD